MRARGAFGWAAGTGRWRAARAEARARRRPGAHRPGAGPDGAGAPTGSGLASPGGRAAHADRWLQADARLVRAKARLDSLSLYPRPVRIDRVRMLVIPWFFRLPRLRRYSGYALVRTILLRRADASEDLVTHELCHVWQMQHRPVHVVLTYLTTRYRENPYEAEARRAVELTR